MMERFKVRIAFLDVGQGDAIVVSIPEKQEAVVIDCARAKAVLTYLEKEKIKFLRGLVITHLHLDHYKESVEFLNGCERELGLTCERLLFNWPLIPKSRLDQFLRDTDGHSDVSDNQKVNQNQQKTAYIDLKKWVKAHDDRHGALSRQYDVGKLQLNGSIESVIELLHPRQAHLDDLGLLNNASGVLKVQGLKSNAILMGDLEFEGWQYLCSKPVDLRCDVLKFPHHGAWKNADPNLLLDAIEPSVVIISVGTQGAKYNHPNSHVFEAIAKRHRIRLLCTQATEQCEPNLSTKVKSVKQLFAQQAAIQSGQFYHDQSGCPCAGTVIVELGESAFILQPHAKFHRETIITPTSSLINVLFNDL